MDLLKLKDEILIDPANNGYAQHLPACDVVAGMLNAKTHSRIGERFVNARTIMAECSDSAEILAGLKSMAANSAQVECAWNFLNTDAGLDVGNERTIAMCDQFAALGVWSNDQAAQVKAMALCPSSRADEIGLGTVTHVNVSNALFNDDGSNK